MAWVKFHDKLCKGAKRGLPRAVRFVFMELCLEARPSRGILELPVGMSDLDALHDILGGNRKEIAEAIRLLTSVPPPLPDDPDPRAMVELTGADGHRRLTIPSWETWNTGQELPGASTERSRRLRNRRTGARQEEQQTRTETAPCADGNGETTAMQRPLHGEVQRDGVGSATIYREEKRRSEKIRGDQPEDLEAALDTHRARASATAASSAPEGSAGTGPGQAEPPRGTVGSTEELQGILLQYQLFADVCASDRLLEGLLSPVLVHGLTARLVGKAAKDFVTKKSGSATRWGPEELADQFGSFLGNARKFDRRTSANDPGEARALLEHFNELWAEHHDGSPRGCDADDEEHAATLLTVVKEASKKCGAAERDLFRHVVGQYLDDRTPFVADANYPLRLLPKRFSSYDLPRRQTPKPVAATRPKADPITPEQRERNKAELEAIYRKADEQYKPRYAR